MSRRRRRDIIKISNTFSDPMQGLYQEVLPDLLTTDYSVRSPLREVEDRREWHPDPVEYASGLRSRVSPVHWPAKPAKRPLTRSVMRPKLFGARQMLAFTHPPSVVLCIRRQIRKEVIHALKNTGKKFGRGGAGRAPKRNQWSNIKC